MGCVAHATSCRWSSLSSKRAGQALVNAGQTWLGMLVGWPVNDVGQPVSMEPRGDCFLLLVAHLLSWAELANELKFMAQFM